MRLTENVIVNVTENVIVTEIATVNVTEKVIVKEQAWMWALPSGNSITLLQLEPRLKRLPIASIQRYRCYG